MLTSYRGVSITYDQVGNPLSYYNGSSYTFSWTGRQLTGITKGNRVSALSPGFQFGIGIKDGEFYYKSGFAVLFGYDFYIRIKLE